MDCWKGPRCGSSAYPVAGRIDARTRRVGLEELKDGIGVLWTRKIHMGRLQALGPGRLGRCARIRELSDIRCLGALRWGQT